MIRLAALRMLISFITVSLSANLGEAPVHTINTMKRYSLQLRTLQSLPCGTSRCCKLEVHELLHNSNDKAGSEAELTEF